MADAPVDVCPGRNKFTFEWQWQIQWKEVSFFYDSTLLRKPMIGLDIWPSEPTQTIELNPLFLIPSHVQNVRLVFHSRGNIITVGLIRMICLEGLLVVV